MALTASIGPKKWQTWQFVKNHEKNDEENGLQSGGDGMTLGTVGMEI